MSDRPLVFATRNRGKLGELRRLLPEVHVLSIDEAEARLGRPIPEVVEDRDTFAGNAEKKAREVSAATGWPALADDSGLEVDALGGAPGVYSARYAQGAKRRPPYHDPGAGESNDPSSGSPAHAAGDGGTAANNAKLLAAMAGVAQRTARFRAVLALADVTGPLGDEVVLADGVCEGSILDELRGTGGFGYDPLFLLERGLTMAEISEEEKSAISHRGLAMHAIKPRLLAYLTDTTSRGE